MHAPCSAGSTVTVWYDKDNNPAAQRLAASGRVRRISDTQTDRASCQLSRSNPPHIHCRSMLTSTKPCIIELNRVTVGSSLRNHRLRLISLVMIERDHRRVVVRTCSKRSVLPKDRDASHMAPSGGASRERTRAYISVMFAASQLHAP